jgi:monoterpene epsilon-lactone hydrolase
MRRSWDYSVVDIDDHELHLFAGGESSRPVILYLHGGGYMFGPFGPEWKLAEGIAVATGSDLGVFLYPRAPEHTASRTVAATIQAFAHLGERYPTGGVTVIGASAGGGLAVAIACDASVRDGIGPTSVVLISPAVDMAPTADTSEREDLDVLLSPDFIRLAGELYAGSLGIDHPWVSPINGDLENLPPIQTYAGEYEILLPSIRSFADHASDTVANS